LEGQRWDLAAVPSLLASISTSSSSHITTAALAPDASAVAAADRHKLRLFRLQRQQQEDGHSNEVAVTRVKLQQQLGAPVVSCTFSSDSSTVFAVTGTGRVVAVDVATGEVLTFQQLTAAASGKGGKAAAGKKQQQQWCSSLAWAMPCATAMAASSDGQLLAVATASGVELLSAAAGSSLLQPLRQLSLLGEPSVVTAVQFNPTSKVVAVATAANSFAAYETDSGLPTQWSLQHQEVVGELMPKLPGSIAGLSFQPCAKGQEGAASVLAYSPGGLCHIDMDQLLLPFQEGVQYTGGSSKQRRKMRHKMGPGAAGHDAASASGRNGRLLKLEDSCLLVGHCSRSEVVLVEQAWQEVLQALLPPVYRQRYGR
jgi:WD40 repeat protein